MSSWVAAGLEAAPDTEAEGREEAGAAKQRQRLQGAGKRRLAAGESRRPRSWQSRIGNSAARRDARALCRVRASRRLAVVIAPGIAYRVEPAARCGLFRCSTM